MMMRSIVAVVVLAAGAARATPAPDYVLIRHEISVERPIATVWARVGGYCAISRWMKVSCAYASGSGDVGTVRVLRDATIVEVMVAATTTSYTYLQTQGAMAAAAYHGTLAAEPDGPSRTRLVYTLFYDAAALDPAVRASEHARLDTRFAGLLGVMKALAEE